MPAAKKSPATAQVAEAAAEPKTVEFKGRAFTLPDNPEIGFFYEAEQGHFISAIADLLGPTAFAQLRALRPKMDEFNVLAQDILDAYGLTDQGN